MQNRYAGRCAACHEAVAPGAGQAIKLDGRWAVLCASTACARRVNAPEPAPASTARRLGADGRVELPYDSASLPIVRSMPGARWDSAARSWSVSLAPGDRPRVLELAARLGLDVAPELLEVPLTDAQSAAIERARTAGGYPYQIEGVRWLALRDRALLADDMGLGKTFQVLQSFPDDCRVLAVVPAALKLVWRDEAARWRPELRVTILVGRDAWQTPTPGEIVITNYDILPAWLSPPAKGQPAPVPPEIASELPSLHLVCDEAHKVKGRSQRSARVKTLARACGRVTFLTGTPLVGRPFDLWGVLDSGQMAGEALGGWNGFLRLFRGHKGRWGGYEFDPPLPEAAERLRRVMLRRRREEVLPDLPRKRYQTVTTNAMGAGLRRELDEAWESWGEEGDREELPSFAEMSRLRRELAESRIPAMLELVESYEDAGTPLVVMSAHRAPIDALAAREGWAVITGDTSGEGRSAAVRRFQAGELHGIACTIQAGGVGITLTRASHVLGILAGKQALIEAAVENEIEAPTPRAAPGAPRREETDEELDARIRWAAEKVERQAARERVSAWAEREGLGNGHGHAGNIWPLSDALRAVIREAHEALLAVCDGARARDDRGFNSGDAGRMRWLALTGYESDAEYRLALRTLRGYPRQLRDEFPELWKAQI